MKILYLITGLGLGGAENVVANLADQMVARGHEVKIAYLTGNISVRPKTSDIEIIYLGLESSKNLFSASRKYQKLIKKYQPDVVHAHMVHANIFARINRLFSKIPKLICTAHSSNEGGKLRMLAYRFTNWLSDFNTNVSKEATLSLINKGAFSVKNITTIYNGIELKNFSNKNSKSKSNNTIQFLSVGRLEKPKDYPNLLKAIKLVSQQYSNIHFNIAGKGHLRSTLEKLIDELNITSYITLLGSRDDIPDLMQSSDFFILSSAHEGLPTVLLEAQASELFVIATDCGGSKEIMNDTGILVPPQNSEALAQAIITAIEMPKEAIEENNKKALKHVQDNFDLNKIVDLWETIYEEK